MPSLQGQEEKCRITLDRVAPFVERGPQADPPAFLEPSHVEKADRGHGNPDPTRFGTTDEAAGLSTEGLLNAAQVEDQRRRVENGTGLTHGVDGESAPNERCDARGSRRTRAGALGWSEGARRECRAAGRCRADLQGPFRPSRFRRRRQMRRQPGDWPSAARQHDRLTGAAHLVGDSAEVAARVDDRNALHHLNTGSVHFDFRPPQRGKLMNVGGEPPTSSPSPPRGELRPWSPGTHTGTRRRLTEPQPADPLAALRSMCGIFRSRPPTGSAASPACSRTV